jgi:phosphatidyl-myo-inositol alpha-mannosyltransferase
MRPSIGRIHGRIAVSAAARHFIERFFPGDYKVIPNGVDTARFARAVPIARWQDGTKNILFVGRFESRKGLLDLLKAYRILRKTGCECRLLVAGGGPQDKEMRRYLLTRKLGGVEFLGRVSDDERDALFKTVDVYCSPATGRESFGIVLLEAMAAGTAIVCSDIHGYKGVVRRNQDALLVPPGDSKALASALARILSDDELRETMARSGLARAQEYSWERVTAKVEDYYGFVIRRLASQGQLPSDFHAPIPPSPRVPVAVAVASGADVLTPASLLRP